MSQARAPSSTYMASRVAVKDFVLEPMAKSVSGVTGSSCSTLRQP